ncbi:nitronate monooxygenase [Bacillaceae bacterium JMAK1]|nr:nitronate monooxygenase [Bacillaceae bacterium JMAK1]
MGESTLFGVKYPIIQAGMAGGATSPQLVATVCNFGGLGTIGGGYMSPNDLRTAIQEVKKLTDQPFAVNLFIPEQSFTAEEIAIHSKRGMELTQTFRDRLGLATKTVEKVQESFEQQFQVVLDEKVPVFSFTFGIPSGDQIAALKAAGIVTCGTATTVEEAKQIEQVGIDTVVAQGSEAGGHRGSFIQSEHLPLIGTMALVPQIVDHVRIPVIAAGGIMDERGVAAAFALGASGAQVGTAFLTTTESGAHSLHKEQLLQNNEANTEVTYAFSGKAARGIRNAFIEAHSSTRLEEIPPYPIQNAVTQDLRKASSVEGDWNMMSLWAGQGIRLAEQLSAEQLMQKLTKAIPRL